MRYPCGCSADGVRHCLYEKAARRRFPYKIPVRGERKEMKMTLTQKRMITLIIVVLAAVVLGRLAVPAVMNLLLGGSMFGGNFL